MKCFINDDLALSRPPEGPVASYIVPFAVWLGHESVETTQIYLEATLAMKEAALAKTSPYSGKSSHSGPTTICWSS